LTTLDVPLGGCAGAAYVPDAYVPGACTPNRVELEESNGADWGSHVRRPVDRKAT